MAKEQLDRIEGKLDKLTEWVFGNGRAGAKVDIDRLKRNWKLFQWAIGIGAAGVVTLTGVVVKVWIGQP